VQVMENVSKGFGNCKFLYLHFLTPANTQILLAVLVPLLYVHQFSVCVYIDIVFNSDCSLSDCVSVRAHSVKDPKGGGCTQRFVVCLCLSYNFILILV